jgi:MoaA/NifB/PqqE/SkfB family radical SAM enzyme
MTPDLLDKILKKAASECHVIGVGLYNWAEALLHPQLPELVRIVRSHGIECHLSSNLNVLRNVDSLMAANPEVLRVSVSGFSQAIYGVTHRGGNIEQVKENMVELAGSKRRMGASTRLQTFYLRYRGNLDDERLMRKFSEDLGYEFMTWWAFMMPLEKVLAYVDGDSSEATITAEDREVIERLVIPLKDAIAVTQRYGSRPCPVRDSQVVIDFQGNVQHCCAVYDSEKHTVANYLTESLDNIQKRKCAGDACRKCMSKGVHIYYTCGIPELEQMAKSNILRYYADYLG